MLKVEEVAQSALSAVDSEAGRTLASTWVDSRYKELIGRVRFKHTRKVGELAVPATITAGLVTTVRGSNLVTPDATALAAWSSDQIGWHFRSGITWYTVQGFVGGHLVLASPYAEGAVTLGGYTLAKRIYDLPVNVRSLDLFIFMRLRLSFTTVPLEFLDTLAPSRNDVSSWPRYVAEVGQGVNGGKSLEVYPLSTTSELLHYVYRELPERLKMTDSLPGVIDGYVLKAGVLIDVMRWEMAKAAKAGKVDIAALWRNDSRAQETIWERKVQAAILADQGVDDYTLVMGNAMGSNRLGSDIVNASDQVWNRG